MNPLNKVTQNIFYPTKPYRPVSNTRHVTETDGTVI